MSIFEYSRKFDQMTINNSGRTENPGHESEGELGGKDGEEPRCSVKCGADFEPVKVVVQVSVKVVQESRELVQLDLKFKRSNSGQRIKNKLLDMFRYLQLD